MTEGKKIIYLESNYCPGLDSKFKRITKYGEQLVEPLQTLLMKIQEKRLEIGDENMRAEF